MADFLLLCLYVDFAGKAIYEWSKYSAIDTGVNPLYELVSFSANRRKSHAFATNLIIAGRQVASCNTSRLVALVCSNSPLGAQ